MPKWILLIALAATAIVGGWLLTRSPQSVGGLDSDYGLVPEPDSDQVPALTRSASDQPVAPIRGPQEGGVEIRDPRTTLGTVDAKATEGGEFIVVAKNPRRRGGVEGMRVMLLDRKDIGLTEWQTISSDPQKLRKIMNEQAAEQYTDDDGNARFHGVLHGAILAEGKGFQATADWIGPVESPFHLRLIPLKELRVKVTDDEGIGVREVPVWVGPDNPSRWLAMAQRTTNAGGIAELTGISKFSNRAKKDEGLALYVGFPHDPRPMFRIDPEFLPDEIVDLKLPPSAPMKVRVIGADGKPIEGSFKVDVGLGDPRGDDPFQSIVSRRSTTGEVEFPHIGLGTQLQVRLSGIPEMQDVIESFRGPSRAGETLEIELSWVTQRTIFVGIAQMASGTTLSNRRVRCTWGNGKDNRSMPLTTGDGGEFRLVTSGPIASFLQLEALAAKGTPPASANPTIPAGILRGGEINLGSVRFDEDALFAEGKVVDSNGVPVPGAYVRVESFSQKKSRESGKRDGQTPPKEEEDESNGKGGGKGDTRGEGGFDRGGNRLESVRPGGSDWRPVPKLSALTDSQGKFKIYGKAYGTLRLQATRRGLKPGAAEGVTAGARFWTLTMVGKLSDVDAQDKADREADESGEGAGGRR